MSSLKFETLNCTTSLDSDPLLGPFSLSARADTDVFRTPNAVIIFNAPFYFTRVKLTNHVLARVSLAPADANGKPWSTLYDQAGLCLVLNVPLEPAVIDEAHINASCRWIKAGVEVFPDKPVCGVVACDRFADWSLVPLSEGKMTIELVREVIDGKKTETLWVWAMDTGNGRRQMREITWVFGEEVEALGGVYVAKPRGEGDLEAKFEDFKIVVD